MHIDMQNKVSTAPAVYGADLTANLNKIFASKIITKKFEFILIIIFNAQTTINILIFIIALNEVT